MDGRELEVGVGMNEVLVGAAVDVGVDDEVASRVRALVATIQLTITMARDFKKNT